MKFKYTVTFTGILEFLWSSDVSRWFILEDNKNTGIWIDLPETATQDELAEAWRDWRDYKPYTKVITVTPYVA